MLNLDALNRHPGAFPNLTGMTQAEFEALAVEFQQAERLARQADPLTRRGRPRRHTPGGGRPFGHDARTRLFLALLWLRIYPTYEVLGLFFDLHKRNAQLNVRHVLEVLETLEDFPFDRPDRGGQRPRCAAEVMAAFPQVRLIIDAKEQRINRPEGEEAQKPYYSGKKKAHTLKTQVVVDPCGRIEAVSDSVPGGAHHDLTLLRSSGVLERLEDGEAAMMDKGYVGVKTSYPHVPIVLPFRASRGHPLTAEQLGFNRLVARHRIVVEHTMAQLNRFTVLRQVFRAKHRKRHGGVVSVVAKLVNRRLRVKPLKRYVA